MMRAANRLGLAAGLCLALLTACGPDTGPEARRPEPAPLPPPSPGAAINIEFTYVSSSEPVQNLAIYLLVQDAEGKAVHNSEAVTNANGLAFFDNLPVGEFTIQLWDERNNRWQVKTDLTAYTGSKRGGIAAAFML